MSPKNREKTLKKLALGSIENMKKENNFTHVVQVGAEDTTSRYKTISDADMTYKRGKSALVFDLMLETPLELSAKEWDLSIYDRTHYVDMSWVKASDVFFDKSQDNCKITIIKPNPTSKQMAYAVALPADATPDYELGKLFTQRARISCK